MVMEKKCSEEDLLCRSVVGFCCGCFDGFSSFWGLLSNARVGGGLLWGMKNLSFSKHGSCIFWIGKSVRGIQILQSRLGFYLDFYYLS